MLQRINRRVFFTAYRREFNGLTRPQVAALEVLLSFMEADQHLKVLRHAAYMLATAKHETDDTYRPIQEYGSYGYFEKRYGHLTRKGSELGNDAPGEGAAYSGKGYPQTTGEANFEKSEDAIRREYPDVVASFEARTGKRFDLTVGDQPGDQDDPKNMMDPEIAYVTMSFGMRTGMFTGKKLSDYINDLGTDYLRARKIINGMDRAQLVAGYAKSFERALALGAKAAAAGEPETMPVGPAIAAATIGAPAAAAAAQAADPQTFAPPAAASQPPATEPEQPKPTVWDRLGTSTTLLQSSGIQVGSVITGIVAFFAYPGTPWILLGCGVVAITAYFFYQRGETAKQRAEAEAQSKIRAAELEAAARIEEARRTEPSPEQVAALRARWEAERAAAEYASVAGVGEELFA